MKKRLILSILLISTTVIFGQSLKKNVERYSTKSVDEVLPYFQDFEGATFLPDGWQAFGSNSNAAWEHSNTIGGYGNSTGSAFFDNFTSNNSGNYYGMRAVTLDLTGTTAPTMSFDVAYAKRNSTTSDRLGIWYSYNGTTGWNNLVNYQHGTLATAPDQDSYFIPTNEQWNTITIDLTQFAGTPLIRFAFENNSSHGNVLYIDNVHFFDNTLGVNEQNQNSFTIYPNPTEDVINITSMASVTRFEVYNSIGQIIYSEINTNTVNVSELVSGIYFVKIKDEEGNSEIIKVIKK